MSPREPEATRAIYVRLPLEEADRLDRIAAGSGRSKRDVITSLLSELDASPRRVVIEDTPGQVTVGHHRFTPAPAPEVLTLEEAAELLRVDPQTLLARAQAGELPGRELDGEWRFRREALLEWLGSAA